MRRFVPTAIALLVALPHGAEAHRLDEYLQATRIAVSRHQVELEIDLTPGVAIAAAVFPLIDRNGDGVVTVPEIEAYARSVLKDLAVEIDGRAYQWRLTRAESPSWLELRDGVGTVRVEATAAVPLAGEGIHRIRYENLHQPEISVYLANALVPASRDISIVRQERDLAQRRFDLDIDVNEGHTYYGWLTLQGILVALLLAYRAR